MPKDHDIDYSFEKLNLFETMYSIFTHDEIQAMIKHRQYRGMKTLTMPKHAQDDFKAVIVKIQKIFDPYI